MRDYVPPPPPPARADSGCWKWGGITCGLGCLAMVLLIAVGIFAMGPKMRAFLGRTIEFGQDTAQCQMEMNILWKKVQKYHDDKGKYPEKLKDLVPNYIPSESSLHFSKKPDGPEFAYHKPGPNDQDTTVVLEYTLTITGPDGKVMDVPIQWQKNGRAVQGVVPVQHQPSSAGSPTQ